MTDPAMTYTFKKIPTRNRLRTVMVDLSDIIFEEAETLQGFKPLADAAVIFLREASDSVSRSDNQQMNKDLIISAMDFSQRWENWLKDSRLCTATRIFHEMLLRFFKGSVKAYRCWLIDLRK